MPHEYICPECSSTNLMFDAQAEWDNDKQRFILGEVFHGVYCYDCADWFNDSKTREIKQLQNQTIATSDHSAPKD